MNVTINVELSTSTKRDGTQQLMLRVTENRKHKRVKLDWSIKKKDWNQPAQEVRRTDPRFRQINEAIRLKKSEVEEQLLQNIRDRKSTTAAGVVRVLKGEATGSFLTYAATVLERKRGINYGTWKRYNTIINKVKQFQKGQDLRFDELTVTYLKNFESYLRKLGNSQNTIASNMRVVRAILYEAMREELTDQAANPFFQYRLKTEKARRTKLTAEEVLAMEDLQLEAGTLIWHCRNAFLFSFYQAGMRVGDVLFSRFSDYDRGRNEYEMGKTKKRISIKVVDKALSIFDGYKRPEARPQDFIFPFLAGHEDEAEESLIKLKEAKTALINKYLKLIAAKAGIAKPVTMHVARHSFASIARRKTDVYAVSKLLGHTSVKITETYLEDMKDDEIDNALDRVFGD